MTRRFPYARTFLLGFGFLGISIIWPIFNQYVPIFLQAGNPEYIAQLAAEGRTPPDIAGLGLAPGLAFFVMTWDNLINVFVQPWVGERSDRTWNRFGRRKGWILLGAPVALLGFVFIPAAQSVLAMMAYILITNFGMALFRSPTVAWLGDLFEPAQRSKANGVINLMGGAGGLLAFFAGGWLFNSFGRSAPFVAGAVATLAAMVVVVLLVREPQEIAVQKAAERGVLTNLRSLLADPDKSGLFVLLSILLWFIAYSALDTALSSFAVFTLGMTPGTASISAGAMAVSFLIFAIPAGLLADRLGRQRTIQIGLVGLVALLLIGYFVIRDQITFILVLVFAGGFWALVNVNSLPLVYDHGDERKIGAYTGLYYFASQSAAVIGPVLAGVMVESLANNYRWVWVFSMVFMALAWMTMTRVRSAAAKPPA